MRTEEIRQKAREFLLQERTAWERLPGMVDEVLEVMALFAESLGAQTGPICPKCGSDNLQISVNLFGNTAGICCIPCQEVFALETREDMRKFFPLYRENAQSELKFYREQSERLGIDLVMAREEIKNWKAAVDSLRAQLQSYPDK